jgi:hypothetical protein
MDVRTATLESQESLREASGRFQSSRPLVGFLYGLMRDLLPTGKIAELCREAVETAAATYTNGFLARYAEHIADELVPEQGALVCDHTAEIEEIAKLKKFLDVASTDVERFRAQHDKDLTLIEGLQEARAGAIRASTEWHDQTIELGAKIARLETDRADILKALAMAAADHLDCDCGLGPVGCIGVQGDGAGFGCDRCCAHAGVDGWCVRLPDLENESEVSPAASLMRVVPPVQSHGGAVGEDVSPALSGQEAGHAAEGDRGQDRAFPPGDVAAAGPGVDDRAVLPAAAEGGDHHVDPAGGSDGRESAGRRQLRGPLGVRAEFRPPPSGEGSLVQRDAEAGALELADEGLKNSQQEPEPRDQVAGVEGSTDEGPAHAPEDRGAVVPHAVSAGSADPGEGATASPAAAKGHGCSAYPDGEHRTSVYTACACQGGDFIRDDVWNSADIDPAIYPGRAADLEREQSNRKEITDQAAHGGAGHPVNDSPGAIAGEKAAETRTATPNTSVGTTSDLGAPVAGEAGPALQPDPRLPDEVDATRALLREGEAAAESGQVSAAASKAILDKIESDWTRAGLPAETTPTPRSEVPIAEHRWGAPPAPVRADGVFRPEDQAFHLWASEHDAEAACGETTGEEFELLPKGALPPVENACITCADMVGWTEPGQESMLPVEAQTELALSAEAKPDDGKRPCARCSHPTKRFCSSESTVVGPWLAFRGKPLCSKCSGILREQEKAQRPRCKGFNKAAGTPCESEPKPGSDFCGRHAQKAKPAALVANG